jgi:hypothetical protein
MATLEFMVWLLIGSLKLLYILRDVSSHAYTHHHTNTDFGFWLPKKCLRKIQVRRTCLFEFFLVLGHVKNV